MATPLPCWKDKFRFSSSAELEHATIDRTVQVRRWRLPPQTDYVAAQVAGNRFGHISAQVVINNDCPVAAAARAIHTMPLNVIPSDYVVELKNTLLNT